MDDSNFPTTKESKRSYYIAVTAHINSDSTRLDVKPADLSALSTLMGSDTTPGSYLNLFVLWADERTTRTTDVITQLNTFEHLIEMLLSKIFNDIPASVWTDTDRNIFHRKKGLAKVITHSTTPITANCVATVVPLGGGDVKFSFRTLEGTFRPRKVKNAEGVDIAFKLVPQPAQVTGGPETVGRPHQTVISGPDDGTTYKYYTKSCLIDSFGTDSVGMDLQFFARWSNPKHPQISGPWTGPFTHILM